MSASRVASRRTSPPGRSFGSSASSIVVQHLLLAAAGRLHGGGVAVEDLEHRQRRPILRQFPGHVMGRHQGHEGVIAVVILAAERAGVGQGGGRHQCVQADAGFQLLHEDRQQFVGGRFLDKRHKRLAVSEGQGFGAFRGEVRRPCRDRRPGRGQRWRPASPCPHRRGIPGGCGSSWCHAPAGERSDGRRPPSPTAVWLQG